jgi:hypothetical protein
VKLKRDSSGTSCTLPTYHTLTPLIAKMSAASHDEIDRWNVYKSRLDSAGSAVIRSTQWLVRPTGGFPRTSDEAIQSAWTFWRDEEEVFWRMTRPDDRRPIRRFPVKPEAGIGEPCCFRMWGLLIQVQIEGTHGSTEYLRELVQEIAANQKCQSHPATCPCHVPEHPWVYKDDVDAMEPIRPLHNPKCQCAGYLRCAQRESYVVAVRQHITAAEQELAAHPELKVAPCRCDARYANIVCSCVPSRVAEAKAAAAAAAAQKPSSAYDYKHNVDSCPCGTCHKARLDSGTADEYLSRVQLRSHAVFPGLAEKPAKGIGAASYAADVAIGKASAACGGGATHPGFAQALFAAMGTPHDSKCPHGIPFYACMPCSH